MTNAFEEVYEVIKPRLNMTGEIASKEVYESHTFSQGMHINTYRKAFKSIMDLMCEQNKAMRLQSGIYKITKPNEGKTTLKGQIEKIFKVNGLQVLRT